MTREKAEEIVAQSIHQELWIVDFVISDTISDYCDSLELVMVTLAIEDKIQGVFPTNLDQFKTVDDVVKFVESCEVK